MQPATPTPPAGYYEIVKNSPPAPLAYLCHEPSERASPERAKANDDDYEGADEKLTRRSVITLSAVAAAAPVFINS